MTKLSVGAIFEEMASLLRRNAWRIAIAAAAMTALAVLADIAVPPSRRSGLDLLTAIVSVVLQYWLTAVLMMELGRRRGDRRIATVFGIGVLSALGVTLGLLIFIVPGLVLLVRWSIGVPYALGENSGVIESMSASFDQTKGAFWPILIVLLVCYAPAFMAAAGTIALLEDAGPTLYSSVLLNLFVNGALIAGWRAAHAFYLLLRPEDELSDLFA